MIILIIAFVILLVGGQVSEHWFLLIALAVATSLSDLLNVMFQKRMLRLMEESDDYTEETLPLKGLSTMSMISGFLNLTRFVLLIWIGIVVWF